MGVTRCLLVVALAASLVTVAGALDAGPARPGPVVVKVEDGFHWQDAGLGAAAAVAAAVAILGLGLILRGTEHGRRHDPADRRYEV